MWETIWEWVKENFGYFIFWSLVVVCVWSCGSLAYGLDQGTVAREKLKSSCADLAKNEATLESKAAVYNLCVETNGRLP